MDMIGWLVAFVILIGIEAATMALTTIWFAGGAVFAFFAAVLEFSVQTQLVVFLIVSFVLLLFTRPLAIRFVNRETVKTNVDGLIGRKAKVIKKIDNNEPSGAAVIDGQEWTARSADEAVTIPVGTHVVRKKWGIKIIPHKNIKEDIKMPTILVLVLIFIILLILVSCIRIVPQAQAMVVERLGAYLETWNVGIHFKVPFIDRVAKRVLLKEQVVDFAPQPVITKDNVTMKIDTVVFFQITDPKLYAYGVENPIMAIENLTATTLRNIIGDLELDQTLTSRETINTKMRSALDVATDPWGIKVNRVELKNIIPPAAIQDAMEKQMKAERERREAILRAEGEKKSTILVAEGKKQSAILDAEADKQAAILHAEAEKEKRIREAEGQAEAILKIQQANADGIRMIKDAGADQAVLQLKSLEAFAKAADGKETKIIIPSEIQSLAGLVTSVTEIAKKSETEN